jgi:hypothetical protein
VFDFRYHVASLVAVIVMLGVGMLLGSAIVDRGELDKQRVALVNSLQKDFGALKQTNDQLKADLARDRAFATASGDAMVTGRLAGRTIVVLVNDGRNDALTPVTAAIQKAGGKVGLVRFTKADLGLAEDTALAGRMRTAVDGTGTAGELATLVGRELGGEWRAGGIGKGPVSQALLDSGRIRLEDVAAGTRADGVVVLATWDGKADPAVVELAKELLAQGVPAIAAEPRARGAGVVDAAAGAGLSTVDDVDTPSGAYSLDAVLAGLARGRFGTGPGAGRPFADVPPK